MRLLYETDESILALLPQLDLFNISEIKRQKSGAVEIKFFDRIKALEKLGEITDDGAGRTALSFYDALEKSAKSINEKEGLYD